MIKKEKKNRNENDVNQLMQYYLFLADYLEKAKKEEASLKYLLENISIQSLNKRENNDINNENNEKSVKVNINELILRLYKLAYKNSGKSHRDFPYFSFYKFLNDIDLEELKAFNDLLKEEEELKEIYSNLVDEKDKILKKQEKIKNKKNSKDNNNIIIENNNDLDNGKSNDDMEKKISKPLQDIENPPFVYFNLNTQYVINSGAKFNSSKNNNIDLSIINKIGELLTKAFPNENDLKEKNAEIILKEVNEKIKDNTKLIELLGQLKYLDLNLIDSKIKCLSFWLNCFNYLLLFTIFYRKWNLNKKKNGNHFSNM